MVDTAFAPLLDPHSVRELLAAPLPRFLGTDLAVAGCEVVHARRRTFAKAASSARTFLTFVYDVALCRPDRPAHVVGRALVHGRASFRDPAVASPGVLGIQSPPLWLELRRFPDDPALPQLALLADPARAREAMPAEARALVEDAELDVRVASFRPGERCTLAYTDAGGRARVYAKTYADEHAAAAVAGRVAELARYAARGALLVPRPLGFDRGRSTVWQESAIGVAPSATLGTAAEPVALAAVAAALAELHSAPAVARPVARAARLEEATRKARKLESAGVVAAADLRELLSRCATALPALPRERFELRHGDAHLGQFLLDGARVAMFDCDELAGGDLEQDLAALAVELEDAALAGRCAGDAADALRAAYCTADAAPRTPDDALYAFHYGLQRLDRAYRVWWRRGAAAHEDARRSIARALDEVQP